MSFFDFVGALGFAGGAMGQTLADIQRRERADREHDERMEASKRDYDLRQRDLRFRREQETANRDRWMTSQVLASQQQADALAQRAAETGAFTVESTPQPTVGEMGDWAGDMFSTMPDVDIDITAAPDYIPGLVQNEITAVPHEDQPGTIEAARDRANRLEIAQINAAASTGTDQRIQETRREQMRGQLASQFQAMYRDGGANWDSMMALGSQFGADEELIQNASLQAHTAVLARNQAIEAQAAAILSDISTRHTLQTDSRPDQEKIDEWMRAQGYVPGLPDVITQAASVPSANGGATQGYGGADAVLGQPNLRPDTLSSQIDPFTLGGPIAGDSTATGSPFRVPPEMVQGQGIDQRRKVLEQELRSVQADYDAGRISQTMYDREVERLGAELAALRNNG